MNLFALSQAESDCYTLWGFYVGVVGTLVGIVGFAYTIYQVRKVQAAADAARDAATRTLVESKGSYGKFIGAFASRLVAELERAANTNDWKVAVLRVADLAELVGTAAHSVRDAVELAAELRAFGQKFGRDEPKYKRSKWDELLRKLYAEFDRLKAPFGSTQDGQNATNDPSLETSRDRQEPSRENDGPTGELGSEARAK